jgi:zinc/manganese transport system permease protein
MSITFLLAQPFAQHALLAAALVAVSCGLIGPLVVTRGMSFAVHGTAELAFTGAAAGLVIADNPVAGALAGSLVVAALIATLGARPRERDSAIGAILAFGMGIGVLLLGYYQGFATAATNILFGNIFGVSGTQLLILVAIGVVVVAVMATWYRPLLFASVDPEAAEARGVPVRRLGLMFLLVLALTVTGAAQVVGTLLVLSLAITPAAAAQRLSASPLVVAALSIVFAVAAADGGLLASFGTSNVKASVFITSISFAIYLAARLAGPRLRDRRRQRSREERRVQSQARAYARYAPEPAGTEMSRSDGPAGQLDKHVPSGLGWPGVLASRSRDLSPAGRERLGLPP